MEKIWKYSTENARWSGNDWDPLDDADTVDKCNQLAQESSKGPFDWTIHNGKNCSAHRLGGKSVGGMITVNGQTLSKPPGGQTGMIVASRLSTLQQLRGLNARLLNLMQQIYTIVVKIYPKGINNKEQSKYEVENIFKNKRLLADRERINKLSGSLSDVDSQNETLKLQHDANQLLYLGMSVLLVGVAGITYKVMANKSN